MLDRIITKDPSADFLDPLIFNETAKLEAANSLYDIFVMPWSLADNSLIDADLPDAVRLWNEKYAFPKLIIAGSQRILNDFESRYQSIIPEVKGDYTEYWTEGLGSDARSVGRVRHATENLVQMETAWCMLNEDKPSPRSLIDSSWKYCLLGVEHTWGYQNPKAPLAKKIEQTKASYFENSLKTSKELLSETFKAVASAGSNKFAVFNTLSWDRGGLITLTKDESKVGDRVLDENGKAVISQRLSTGELVFWAEKIPALGSKVFTIARGKAKKVKGCFIKGNTISNNFFSVTIDPQTGNISSLVSLKNGHEYVDKKSAFALNSYLYVLGKDSTEKTSGPFDVVLKVKENGPLVASIVAESKAPGCNWLKREVRVVYNRSWIDLTNSFDKISTRVKEGIHFGFAFNVANGTTRIDIPWGVMIPNYDQLPAANRNWLTFQHWVDISNSKVGVTWTAIESPLLEYGRLSPNLRGWAFRQKYWYKKFEKSQTIFSWALNNYWSTNFPLEQGGIIDLHYAILPHGSYDPVTANRFGMDENRPLIAVPVEKKPLTKSWVRIGNPKVFISILKQSDDGKGMILRLRSVSDKPERVQLTWTNETPRKLYSCLANEKPQNEIKSDRTILPYGTISYYFEM
jgi:alpha-mannosidase